MGDGYGTIAAVRGERGLEPGTTYHYWIVASNLCTRSWGPGDFTTFLSCGHSKGGCRQEDEDDGATLEGTVDPEGDSSSCPFRIR